MEEISPKSRLATTLLCILPAYFVAIAGIHRFYTGKIKTAVGMLVLTVLFWVLLISQLASPYPVEDILRLLPFPFIIAVGIGAFIDFLMAISGKMKDKEGKFIKNW